MDLKEFVTETLTQIVAGVKDAQAAVKMEGGEINPRFALIGEAVSKHGVLRHTQHGESSGKSVHFVEFDVALTVVEGKEMKGGIGVFTVLVGIGLKVSLFQKMLRLAGSSLMCQLLYLRLSYKNDLLRIDK